MSVNGNTETNLPGQAIPWLPHRSSINQTREETGRRQRPSHVVHVGAHSPMQIALDWDPDGAVRRRLTLGSESGWPVDVKQTSPLFDTSNETAETADTPIAPSSPDLSATRRTSQINCELQDLVAKSASEEFEDGYVSEIRVRVLDFVREHGGGAINALKQFLANGEIYPHVMGEILRALGGLDDEDTEEARLELLLLALTNASPGVRHAAIMGLAGFRDPPINQELKARLEMETNTLVRQSLEKLLSRALA